MIALIITLSIALSTALSVTLSRSLSMTPSRIPRLNHLRQLAVPSTAIPLRLRECGLGRRLRRGLGRQCRLGRRPLERLLVVALCTAQSCDAMVWDEHTLGRNTLALCTSLEDLIGAETFVMEGQTATTYPAQLKLPPLPRHRAAALSRQRGEEHLITKVGLACAANPTAEVAVFAFLQP